MWQTDGKNYDPQDRASIAASRGKNRPEIARVTVENSGAFFPGTVYVDILGQRPWPDVVDICGNQRSRVL